MTEDIFSDHFSDIFEINNGGDPWTTSSGDVQRCRFDVFVTTERRLHLSIVFIASNGSTTSRSLLALSRMAKQGRSGCFR